MKKRLVICCDGTWNNPEDPNPTNVVRTARSVLPEGIDGFAGNKIPQIVFYDWGVGTGNLGDRLKGGAFGNGLNKNIQDAYRFIVHNYEKDDDLFLFGFSRGAYTARSLAGMIRNCGILTRRKAHLIPRAFTMYRSVAHPDCNSAVKFRDDNSHHRESRGERPAIEFMGVWDTVGALGIPIRFMKVLTDRKHEFHDTRLSGIIKNAYHAVAIDERRGDFEPVLWTDEPESYQKVVQTWFPGVHTDVGGGYDEPGLGNGALQWMLKHAEGSGLAVDRAYLSTFRADPLGKLHRSRKGMYQFKKVLRRPIVGYNVSAPEDALHSSVKKRYQGMDSYRPRELVKFLGNNGINW